MKQFFANHLKNISGWRTKRKLLIISVDDYGNVRIGSNGSLNTLKKEGIEPVSIFDHYDNLESREDLEHLFEVLTSVKDKNGNSAVFTPYALPCNIDFETMAENRYEEYAYELLPQTFDKLGASYPKFYSDAWKLWKEGIEKGLMKPQFHGREHFNLHVFNDLLRKKNENFLKVLKSHSYVAIPEHKDYKQAWTAAYDFDTIGDTKDFLDNIKDGLRCFKEVYGFLPKVFIPPAQKFPLYLEKKLLNLDIKYMDRPRRLKRYLGDGNYQLERHRLGDGDLLKTMIRNVWFEPSIDNRNWANFTFKQIEAAFFWNKPAHISSHRVNYSGYIDEKNREKGLTALKGLLQKVVKRWPEVEFISADQLGGIMDETP